MMEVLSGLWERGRFHLQIRKIMIISVIINTLQIALMMLAILTIHQGGFINDPLEAVLLALAFLFAMVSAALNIRDARTTSELLEKTDQLMLSLGHVEELNSAIRAQRHDFMNHLQVIHSLIELEEDAEALDYIGRIYGDMKKSSRMLRTDSAAINALLSAKIADCEERHIHVETLIDSTWKNLPMPAWEMCRILGNILDNAIYVLEEVEHPELSIQLSEDLHKFTASIINNGPMIPLALHHKLFNEGVTTRGEGHGTGLYIVRRILEEYGGSVELYSDAVHTRFDVFLPRDMALSAHNV